MNAILYNLVTQNNVTHSLTAYVFENIMII